jgi:hypothetical protein
MPAPAFICPPQARECCSGCGSTSQQPCNTGLVALRRRTTLADIEGHARGHHVGRVAVIRLFAWRCPDCHLDVVSDMQTGQVWDLDMSDYGDEGSADPEGLWGPR